MMTTNDFVKMAEAVNVDTCRLRIIFYVLERTDPKSYYFNGSYDEISRGAGTSYTAVVHAMKAAQDAGLLKRIGNSRWHIEKDVFESHGEEPLMLIRNYSRH